MNRPLTASTLLLTALLSACTTGGSTPGPTVKTIDLSPATASVAVGQSTTLTATARDEQGKPIQGVAFTWKSSRETVASVTGGVVKGLSTGDTGITASTSGVTSNPATVTVTQAQPQPGGAFDLTLSGDRLPVVTGTSASLTVNVARKNGFTGAVSLTLSGLPSGASSSAVTIPEGQTSAAVTVSAAANAPHSLPTAVTLTGTGTGAANVTRAITVTVRGPAGSLDTTFGAGGRSVTDFAGRDDYAQAIAMQADGRLVLAGYAPGTSGQGQTFALTRLTRDGAPDPTFGAGGKVQVNFGSGNDQAYATLVQPDGKILAAGFADVSGNRDFALLRLNADGSPDSTFGAGGRVTVAVGAAEDRAYALALQPDGKIVVGGTSQSGAATGLDFALARLNANGTLDPSFGSGGKVVTPVAAGGVQDTVYALLAHGDSLYAVGGETDFMLAKYTSAGTLDPAFGAGGKVAGLFGSVVGRARGVALSTVGGQERLVVAGNAGNDTAVARLTLGGSPDATFGNAGRKVLALSPGWDEASGVAVEPGGKLALGGWAHDTTTTGNFTAVRLLENGATDNTFGTNGVVVAPLAPAGKNDLGRAVLLQPDDRIPATRIVVAGEAVPSFSDFAAIRLWP
ncbi:hypothetical protein DAERI_010001 [Deinococcus aerius]|uniref:BIG2 domain-containing protein n=1 Tax=Deinococcus aerius TaxID=200253 RepID=A0A2I9CQW8_9DEIO|nr:Ig-like domain-containing protein [Deinococcus aerius]GBF03829.1 hypothetical protein DAERI_010001 [Deinococcus aerius]